MKALIDNRFSINIVPESIIYKNEILSLNISYSKLDFPDLIEYLREKSLHQIPISYCDKNQKEDFIIVSFVLMSEKSISKIKEENIDLREDVYGNIVNTILPEHQKQFLLNQIHGTIKLKKYAPLL